jgi:hypothetical protein
MTPSELKYQYQQHNSDGHYFDRKTLEFFGDTMANYKVIDRGHVWELARKKAVKYGLKTPCYFSKVSYDSCSNLEFFEGEK